MLNNTGEEPLPNVLEQIAATRCGWSNDERLGNLTQTVGWRERFSVVETGSPKCWRVTKSTEASVETERDVIEEQIFTIHGTVIKTDLPPFRLRPSEATVKRLKYLKQGIVVAGMGTPTFERALLARDAIHDLFDRTFPEDTLEPLEKAGAGIFSASNRVFTSRFDISGVEESHISDELDGSKNGILREAATKFDFVRTDENEVLYYIQEQLADGSTCLVKSTPTSVRTGDVVELQVSFVVVPLRSGKTKMLTILRSIAVMHRRRQTSNEPDYTSKQATKPVRVKRRIGYAL